MVKLLFISLFISISSAVVCQSIMKSAAIKIAKRDTLAKIKRVETVELIKDSVSLYWVITEKVNVDRECEKIRKSGHGHNGATIIYANVIRIDANTGQIVSRTKKEVGRIDIRGKW